jgi:hypothetical protein
MKLPKEFTEKNEFNFSGVSACLWARRAALGVLLCRVLLLR